MVGSGVAEAFEPLIVLFNPANVLMVPLWANPESDRTRTTQTSVASDLADPVKGWNCSLSFVCVNNIVCRILSIPIRQKS
jgi:hypothetical protein